MSRTRAILVWAALAAVVVWPLAVAATSPLLEWRQPVYIAAGLAGVVALALLFVQPLLAGGMLPGFPLPKSRAWHRRIGIALVAAVVIHVVGLWITSPPDVIDVLLFRSPTPFSVWGVTAMWAVLATALLAVFRRRIRPRHWRLAHTALAAVTVVGTVVHAVLIEGTMGTVSKVVLCALAVLATTKVIVDLRSWSALRRRKA